MARTIKDRTKKEVPKKKENFIKYVPPKIIMYKFKRKTGKHVLQTSFGMKIVRPGDIIEAPQGTYTGDQWECLGPVNPDDVPEDPDADVTPNLLVIEERPEGWYIFNPETSKYINELPLTKKEAETIVSTSLERP